MTAFCRRSALFAGTLAVVAGCCSRAGGQEPSHSQILHRRGNVVSPELEAMYTSPAYTEAYEAAETAYASGVSSAYSPAVWNTKKPQVWLVESRQRILAFVRGARYLNDKLELAGERPEIRGNTAHVAQIAEIQSRLTVNGYAALNQMVSKLDVATLFKSNKRPDLALLWKPWPVPEDTRALNHSKIDTLIHFANDVSYCLDASGTLQVKFARSASFTNDVPKDEDDKPLDYAHAAMFWQWYNHGALDTAIGTLHDNLREARALAVREGLLEAE